MGVKIMVNINFFRQTGDNCTKFHNEQSKHIQDDDLYLINTLRLVVPLPETKVNISQRVEINKNSITVLRGNKQ